MADLGIERLILFLHRQLDECGEIFLGTVDGVPGGKLILQGSALFENLLGRLRRIPEGRIGYLRFNLGQSFTDPCQVKDGS
ncbi:MAG: hypothetical protein R3231_06730 [bacterium]|nr:hypothetical protein [bacterium]